MPSEIITLIEYILLLLPPLGWYVTYVHFKWWRRYRPSPLLKHLLISSVAVDISAALFGIIALTLLLDIDVPSGIRTGMIALGIIIALSVKIWRRFDLRALDHDGEDVTQRVETQDQREDREFGEQRRELEQVHLKEDDENQG